MNASKKENSIYLNTAACGLVSNETASAGVNFIQSLNQNASLYAEHWRDVTSLSIRKNIAHFLEAPENNIALIPNFSYGINAVVQSLKGTEKVLLYDRDYPSLTYPFLVNNFNISRFSSDDYFTIDPEIIEQKLKSEKIDLFAISHVQWLSGAVADLKKIIDICHQYLVPVIIDATQSLGAISISIKELQPDVLIASNYKWMNAGFGTGIIFLSDSFLENYTPVIGGVHSFELKSGQLNRKPSALDFEPGHTNMVGFSILEAAILDKRNKGINSIELSNRNLTETFISECPNLPVTLIGTASMEQRCSIVVLKDEHGLGDWLQKNNFIVTFRNGTIRLSFHDYNTIEEIHSLINCIYQSAEN